MPEIRSMMGENPVDRAGAEVNGEASYDVYVKSGADKLGREDFGPAVAHFVERSNAVALKRRLEARGGDTVHVERSTVYGLSEAEREAWFSDYSHIPEFVPAWEQVRPENPAPFQMSSGEGSGDAAVAAPYLQPSAQGASRGGGEPWWRRIVGGR